MPVMWMKWVLLNLFGYWNTDEIVIFGLENIALHKPTRQTSDVRGALSNNAVDGNLSTDASYCTHTNVPTDTPNWLLVDLEAQYEITSIAVLNRKDRWGDRLRNFTVSVWQYDPGPHINYNMVDTEYCVCVNYPLIVPADELSHSNCTKICLGRFVLFVLNNRDVLTVCELEVFGDLYNGCPTHYLPEVKIKKVEGKRSSPPNCSLLQYEVAHVLECSHLCVQMNNCISFNYRSHLINTINCQLVGCFSHPKQDFTKNEWNWRYLSH